MLVRPSSAFRSTRFGSPRLYRRRIGDFSGRTVHLRFFCGFLVVIFFSRNTRPTDVVLFGEYWAQSKTSRYETEREV